MRLPVACLLAFAARPSRERLLWVGLGLGLGIGVGIGIGIGLGTKP